MRSRSLFLALLFFTFFNSATAQKLKVKDRVVFIDDKEYIKISGQDAFGGEWTLSNLQGKEIVFMKSLPNPKDPKFNYIKISFLGLNQYIELQGRTIKKIILLLYTNNAIQNTGELNKEGVDILVQKYGNSVTGN